MKTRNVIKILLVAAAGVYVVYRSWDQLEQLTDDWVSLFGSLLLIGLLSIGVVRVLRS